MLKKNNIIDLKTKVVYYSRHLQVMEEEKGKASSKEAWLCKTHAQGAPKHEKTKLASLL